MSKQALTKKSGTISGKEYKKPRTDLTVNGRVTNKASVIVKNLEVNGAVDYSEVEAKNELKIRKNLNASKAKGEIVEIDKDVTNASEIEGGIITVKKIVAHSTINGKEEVHLEDRSIGANITGKKVKMASAEDGTSVIGDIVLINGSVNGSSIKGDDVITIKDIVIINADTASQKIDDDYKPHIKEAHIKQDFNRSEVSTETVVIDGGAAHSEITAKSATIGKKGASACAIKSDKIEVKGDLFSTKATGKTIEIDGDLSYISTAKGDVVKIKGDVRSNSTIKCKEAHIEGDVSDATIHYEEGLTIDGTISNTEIHTVENGEDIAYIVTKEIDGKFFKDKVPRTVIPKPEQTTPKTVARPIKTVKSGINGTPPKKNGANKKKTPVKNKRAVVVKPTKSRG
ncbi:MAG: hypothetical protein GY804_13620 [Alphaproteobacteria bacterium]|nr:hypothetical protein [Alphaproteobacteria bacterium]